MHGGAAVVTSSWRPSAAQRLRSPSRGLPRLSTCWPVAPPTLAAWLLAAPVAPPTVAGVPRAVATPYVLADPAAGAAAPPPPTAGDPGVGPEAVAVPAVPPVWTLPASLGEPAALWVTVVVL